MFVVLGLDDARTGLEADKSRLLNQLREVERAALVAGQQVEALTAEKQRLESAQNQRSQEHHELASRLASEAEEKERAQQEMHQLRKQV